MYFCLTKRKKKLSGDKTGGKKFDIATGTHSLGESYKKKKNEKKLHARPVCVGKEFMVQG